MILVTGGSGFVGSHCIKRLLADGHVVRTTVRFASRADDVRKMIGGDAVEFVEADLSRDDGWPEAVRGCSHVLHVASPFPAKQPDNADELIVPAREGALRVLRASRDAGVQRVVMTSSFGAIGYGQEPDHIFTEKDWTRPEGCSPYIQSKTFAERAAWELARSSGLELSVINPTGIFGPALGRDLSSSVGMIKALMTGAMPATPRFYFGVVDVRDVADLHVRAMTSPRAAGERFIAVGDGSVSLHDVALILRERLGARASRVPKREMPDWLMRAMALFSSDARKELPNLGIDRKASNEKARSVLEWKPRSNEDAIVASAESLIELGLV